MSSFSLPCPPSLEQIKKQAKDLLRAYRAGCPEALARFRKALPRLSSASNDQIVRLTLSLRDAQRVLALEYGFTTWSEVKTHILERSYPRMIQMTIDKIRIRPSVQTNVLILMTKGQDRCLPLWIGPTEANAIALGLRNQELPRPLTHDLMDSLIGDLGGRVERVVIKDIKDGTFLANVMMKSGETTLERDARPSDAIALAVRNNAPIFVEQPVLDRVGVGVNPHTSRPEHTDFDLSSFSLDYLQQLLSEEAREVLEQAAIQPRSLGRDAPDPEDVLLALLRKPECTGTRVMAGLGVDIQSAKKRLEAYVSTGAQASDVTSQSDELVRLLLLSAKSEAANCFDVLIETEHLLLACLQSESRVITQIANCHDIGIEKARAAVYQALGKWELSTSRLT